MSVDNEGRYKPQNIVNDWEKEPSLDGVPSVASIPSLVDCFFTTNRDAYKHILPEKKEEEIFIHSSEQAVSIGLNKFEKLLFEKFTNNKQEYYAIEDASEFVSYDDEIERYAKGNIERYERYLKFLDHLEISNVRTIASFLLMDFTKKLCSKETATGRSYNPIEHFFVLSWVTQQLRALNLSFYDTSDEDKDNLTREKMKEIKKYLIEIKNDTGNSDNDTKEYPFYFDENQNMKISHTFLSYLLEKNSFLLENGEIFSGMKYVIKPVLQTRHDRQIHSESSPLASFVTNLESKDGVLETKDFTTRIDINTIQKLMIMKYNRYYTVINIGNDGDAGVVLTDTSYRNRKVLALFDGDDTLWKYTVGRAERNKQFFNFIDYLQIPYKNLLEPEMDEFLQFTHEFATKESEKERYHRPIDHFFVLSWVIQQLRELSVSFDNDSSLDAIKEKTIEKIGDMKNYLNRIKIDTGASQNNENNYPFYFNENNDLLVTQEFIAFLLEDPDILIGMQRIMRPVLHGDAYQKIFDSINILDTRHDAVNLDLSIGIFSVGEPEQQLCKIVNMMEDYYRKFDEYPPISQIWISKFKKKGEFLRALDQMNRFPPNKEPHIVYINDRASQIKGNVDVGQEIKEENESIIKPLLAGVRIATPGSFYFNEPFSSDVDTDPRILQLDYALLTENSLAAKLLEFIQENATWGNRIFIAKDYHLIIFNGLEEEGKKMLLPGTEGLLEKELKDENGELVMYKVLFPHGSALFFPSQLEEVSQK